MMRSIPNTGWILILPLIPLLFLSMMSLREVRLKIGDYYYNQGKYDQAVNWYEKVVKKENLKTNQDKSDRIKYEEDLSKLKSILRQQGDFYFNRGNFDHASNCYKRVLETEKSTGDQDKTNCLKSEEDLIKLKISLFRQMEGILLEVSHLLGFEQATDLKSLFADLKFFQKDVTLLGSGESKRKLQNAEEKLTNFNNIHEYLKNTWGQNLADVKEFDYLVIVSYFFKGLIDEAENNFSSADLAYEKISNSYPLISSNLDKRRKLISLKAADECFYRSPLNWVKAKDLYENHVKSDRMNDIDLFFKLGYIHAKFNNFGDSYNYLKKVYDLLRDPDLAKTVDHFRGKGSFLYPGDMGLLPQKLIDQYPFLRDFTFFETKHLLNILKLEVKARSDGFIGKTGIRSPVDIIVRSAGYFVGNHGSILVNGKNVSQNKRGCNIVVLNPKTGQIEKNECFDTSCLKEDVKKLIDFVKSIEKGKIVCVAVNDEASAQLSMDEGKLFETIGAKENLFGRKWWGYGMIGVQGSRYGDAIEVLSEKPLEISILN